MTDLAQRIRDRLELPTLIVDFIDAKPQRTPEEMEEFRRRFREAAKDPCRMRILPIDTTTDVTSHQIRAALVAVVEYATPGEPFLHDGRDPDERMADEAVDAMLTHVLRLIAENLGIEVSFAWEAR